MTDILNTIRNARDGSMVDIRYDEDGKGAIASFPIKSLRALIEPLGQTGAWDAVVEFSEIWNDIHKVKADDCSHPMSARKLGSPVDRSETCGICGMMQQDVANGRVGWFDPRKES